jgi:site-specific DNA recombinase
LDSGISGKRQARRGRTEKNENCRAAIQVSHGLIQSIVRAHGWIHSLQDGTYGSIEELAEATGLHPKVVRQALRLAFLAPEVTSAIREGRQPKGLSLARIPMLLPLSWTEHRPLLC